MTTIHIYNLAVALSPYEPKTALFAHLSLNVFIVGRRIFFEDLNVLFERQQMSI